MVLESEAEQMNTHQPAAVQRRYAVQWLLSRIWMVTVVVICLLAATTVLSLFARSFWLADLLANLRVQQVIGLLMALIISVSLGRRRWVAIVAVLLAIHLPWFASAFAGRPAETADADLVVFSANVLTSNRQHELIVQQIEAAQADVVAIIELSSPLAKKLERSLTGYPHRTVRAEDGGNFGIGLYSRYPLTEVDRFALNIDRIDSIAVTIEKDDQQYRIVATHPLPPMGAQGYKYRNDHLNMLAERLSLYRQENPKLPMVVVGDMNLTPWSPLFGDFESTTGLRRAGRGYGMTPTWYSRPHFAFGLVLDHGLISEDLTCVSRVIGDDMGSDHRAVLLGIRRNELSLEL